MSKAYAFSGKVAVDNYLRELEPPVAKIVELIRGIILGTDPEIGERIKWNNPSFYYTGEMQAFDPKEYKREIAVFNLFKGRVMLVFRSGAKVKDSSGLLQGNYKDGRRTIIFSSLEDVAAKKHNVQAVINQWLKLVDK